MTGEPPPDPIDPGGTGAPSGGGGGGGGGEGGAGRPKLTGITFSTVSRHETAIPTRNSSRQG